MKLNKGSVFCLLLCVAASLRLAFPCTGFAQVRPVNDYGALGLGQLLKRLNTTASVMMIGAHPDDEDSALLAYLARGESARTAYLSLTRGDGGQNIIGPELGEALGVLRTEELLQARRLDGAEQYFTRAYDYGFSKTLAEARSKWPEEVIKCDAVRAIRLFRPLVVISRFTGTPADGHGQHQYAGYISPIAVKAAADPQQCTDAGTPWQVLKFYVEQSFSDTSQPTLLINTGQYDPMLGRSYFEIAMEGRSMHRSQGEGRLELHGDQYSGLNLAGASKEKHESSIFNDINTSLNALPILTGEREQPFMVKLSQLSAKISEMREKQSLLRPHDAGSGFAEIYKLTYDLLVLSRVGETSWFLDRIMKDARAGLQIATGIQIDALAERETFVRFESGPISVKTYFPTAAAIKVKDVRLDCTFNAVDAGSGCAGVHVENSSEPKNIGAGARRETAKDARYFTATVLDYTPITEPYWLRWPRRGDVFERFATMIYQEEQALPFSPPPIVAKVTLEVGGIEVTIKKPVEYRYADSARGEIRRELNIVPPITVKLDRHLLIVPHSDKTQIQRIVATVTNNSNGAVSGKVGAGVLDWTTIPTEAAFDLKRTNESVNIPFEVTVPAKASSKEFPNSIVAGIIGAPSSSEQTYEMHTIAYPHIQAHRYYTQPSAVLRIIDFKTVPAKIGYIMGSGDEVTEAIRQMGMDVTMLEEKDLASGDLSKYDTIVVGIRASETRPDMMANKQRLLDYVNNGGNLIMQYQRGNFAQSGLAPYPVDTNDKQGTTAGIVARVVDENAAVKILEPANPVFNFPNKITDEDFRGWVQERNAYNLVTFDPKYTPLLESHDAGEQENKGGLVIAKVGKGNWVYCSYSFFRQLPAGVPGAYRLFANLLMLKPAR